MNWVRLMLVVVALGALVVFGIFNPQIVDIDFGFGEKQTIWLPLLVAAAFLLGFVPLYLWARIERAMLKRRIARLERDAERLEGDLSQARVELLQPLAPQPPAPQPQTVPQPAPPPAT